MPDPFPEETTLYNFVPPKGIDDLGYHKNRFFEG